DGEPCDTDGPKVGAASSQNFVGGASISPTRPIARAIPGAMTIDMRIQTYAEFWPFYLQEHTVPACRALHFIATTSHYASGVRALVLMKPWLLLASAVFAYGLPWSGHFVIEKNRPATFKRPFWALISDYRMWGHMVMGRLWSGTNPAEQVGARRAQVP